MDVRVGLWRKLSAKELMLLTVVLEKTLASPLDCKEIQPVYSKGDQPWVFIGRTDSKAETPVLWPPHAKSWLIGKDSDAGRDWGQEEKGRTEDEMAGWHQWLDGHEFEWTPGAGDGQGGLACCNSWGCKESDSTELLNWPNRATELNWPFSLKYLYISLCLFLIELFYILTIEFWAMFIHSTLCQICANTFLVCSLSSNPLHRVFHGAKF